MRRRSIDHHAVARCRNIHIRAWWTGEPHYGFPAGQGGRGSDAKQIVIGATAKIIERGVPLGDAVVVAGTANDLLDPLVVVVATGQLVAHRAFVHTPLDVGRHHDSGAVTQLRQI
jgi:hypothetical protein